ncbi:MAG: riboflavin synthase [Proteobacteria bacterium]|nr:riboflavin synthase [Pseudomonadota bacterium]
MFTGIVEGCGKVEDIRTSPKGAQISISTPFDLSNDKVGDSIAVNGICLTATDMSEGRFVAHVSGETLSTTNIGLLTSGEPVNLERAMKAGERFGGHIVTGHIDGTGKVKKREQRGDSIYFEITAAEDIIGLIVNKGSVAIDGISLTVNSVTDSFFTLNIIPHTLELTTLQDRRTGDSVNIETDIIGKYVERLMSRKAPGKGVDMNMLSECGFI